MYITGHLGLRQGGRTARGCRPPLRRLCRGPIPAVYNTTCKPGTLKLCVQNVVPTPIRPINSVRQGSFPPLS